MYADRRKQVKTSRCPLKHRKRASHQTAREHRMLAGCFDARLSGKLYFWYRIQTNPVMSSFTILSRAW